jgi:drug/metabolite transporter (DMT)-like permease
VDGEMNWRRNTDTVEGHPRLQSYLALMLGILAIGFSAIFIRWAAVPGTVASLYRMVIGWLVLTVPFLMRRKQATGAGWHELRFALLGGLFFAVDLSLWSTGVVISGATNPTLLANTAPLWVGIGATLIFRERLKPLFWFGLLTAMGGAALILGLDSLQSMSLGLGTFFGLVSGLFYGGYFLITQRGRRTIDALSYFWYSSLGAVIILFAINALLRQPLLGYSARATLSLIGLGVVSQGLGWMAINYAQGKLPATLVAPTMLGQPVVTGLLAGPLLGEVLQPLQIAGGMCVLAGIYLVHRSRVRTGQAS